MSKESEYQEVLRQIAFKSLKRKMYSTPPSIPEWADHAGMTAEELWEFIESLGDLALEALKEDEAKG